MSDSKVQTIPWKAIFSSGPVWALIIGQWGHDWGLFTMVIDLPKYMKVILKFNIKQNGLWSSAPYAAMWIMSQATGWLCDWLIMRQYISVIGSRRMFATICKFPYKLGLPPGMVRR